MFVFVVEPFIYLAFLFFNEKVITKAQGLVAIAKKKTYKLNQIVSSKCIMIL